MIDIVTPALVVFERVISGALKNGIIDEEEFNTLQTLHLETLNGLTGVDHRTEVENRSLVEKSLMEEMNELKKKSRNKSLIACSLCYFVWIKYTTNLIIFGKDRKLLRICENLAGRNLRQLNDGYLGKHFGKYIYQLLSELIDLITK